MSKPLCCPLSLLQTELLSFLTPTPPAELETLSLRLEGRSLPPKRLILVAWGRCRARLAPGAGWGRYLLSLGALHICLSLKRCWIGFPDDVYLLWRSSLQWLRRAQLLGSD